MKKSFTIIELVVAIVIVAILASLAISRYSVFKESSLDKEAIANLDLIHIAEEIRLMETGAYYPATGSTNVIANINSVLKVNISALNWSYTVDGTAQQATAGRLPSNSRVWTFRFIGNLATCSGTGCPTT